MVNETPMTSKQLETFVYGQYLHKIPLSSIFLTRSLNCRDFTSKEEKSVMLKLIVEDIRPVGDSVISV